jgi:predicted butyrate kinase (DUF1464 family)
MTSASIGLSSNIIAKTMQTALTSNITVSDVIVYNSVVDNVIKSLRRLPWNSEEENVQFYIVKFVLKSVRTKLSSAANIADCLSGLFKFFPNLVTTVIDKALVEIGK